MPLQGSEVASTRSRLGVATRRGDVKQIDEAKREHATAVIAAHVERIVAEAPRLTPAQCARLAALLSPSATVASGGDQVA